MAAASVFDEHGERGNVGSGADFRRRAHLVLISSESSMNIDKHWFLLVAVAVSAAVGAAFASRSQRGHHRAAHDVQHKENLKAWENEGGNVAPAAASPAQP
jgi:hypothetical protein